MTTTNGFVTRKGFCALSGKCREKRGRPFYLTLVFLLLTVSAMPTLAQDITITSADQLAQVALSADYSIHMPWEPWDWRAYPFGPLWCDFTQMASLGSLPASTNGMQSMDWSNIPLISVILRRDVSSGVTTVESSDSPVVVATIPAPSGYQPGANLEDRWMWQWYVQATNNPDWWGLTPDQIPAATITLHTFLVDSNAYYSVWESNIEAEVEAAAAADALAAANVAMNTDAMLTPMDSTPCTIADFSAPLSITSIAPDGNGNIALTWPSCTNAVFVVQTTTALPATSWTDVGWMFGSDQTTTWTDSNTVGLVQNFYQVVRGNPSALNNGVPYGWAVKYGLDPLDPNLALGDPLGDGFSNLEKYLLGFTPNQYLTGPPGGSVTTLRYYYDQDGRLVDAFYATAGAETFSLTPGHNLQQDNALSH